MKRTGERFLPYIVECSGGFNRLFLATDVRVLSRGWRIGRCLASRRNSRRIRRRCFRCLKNKPELVEKARGIYEDLRKKYMIAWDDRGNIGKRYYAQDEIGTPYCITIDFDTLEHGDVTVRDRDTATQERVKIEDLERFIAEKLE